MTLLGVASFLRIHNEITRGISGGGPKKPSGKCQLLPRSSGTTDRRLCPTTEPGCTRPCRTSSSSKSNSSNSSTSSTSSKSGGATTTTTQGVGGEMKSPPPSLRSTQPGLTTRARRPVPQGRSLGLQVWQEEEEEGRTMPPRPGYSWRQRD